MPKHVALLRGINVGGNNMLPKADLIKAFTDAGCTDVSTYIQSGNVIFRASPAVLKRLADFAAKLIAERHNINTSVVIRSADQLAAAIRSNPFLAAGHPEDTLHLVLLKDTPSAALIRACEPIPGSQEEFIVLGGTVYLRTPNGMARTKLPNFDRKLSTIGTARNWRTVNKLLELMNHSGDRA
jgi:uncharacterized protein (DUF1697 family)